ncbi:helix-turn-helix domain-containing protein [Pseudonocardia sp. HH130630-07]|uniref:helix-turn-helix domain-containing protein n=1 Tax=Pseudonocardia sp. HH130630-07 TaxID=1690815 RepID=UPI001E6037DE|nr:helix-turn-helix transcriptional regulator [Pseudonocardia sp. HH130630-07]
MIPSITRRSSRNGRPRRPSEEGNSGARRAHWTSVRTAVRGTDQASRTPLRLSGRHALEVLALLPFGQTNYQIARRLGITEGTVKRHLTNIYRKLDAVSRINAITKATAVPPRSWRVLMPRLG